MRRIFIQFYLTLVISFIGAIALAGAIYGQVVDKVSDRYLNDIFRATVSLLQTTLREEPVDQWNARLDTLTPPEVLPALVVSYDYYGDATRDAELVARNRVRHPGFVPALPIKVLTK